MGRDIDIASRTPWTVDCGPGAKRAQHPLPLSKGDREGFPGFVSHRTR